MKRVFCAALAAAALAGCHRAESNAGAAAPTVAVAPVIRRDLAREVSLQAEMRPYQEVELGAKVTGYLKSISVDFGDEVKAGQLVATIEVPELHDQLEQAAGMLAKAKAAQTDTHVNYTRLEEVDKIHPNLIAQQDLDTAQAQDLSAAAAVATAQADLDRYQTLLGYTRIVAPFSGVITERFVDPGALIRGGGGQSAPIVRLSENNLLRVDFPVSVADAQDVKIGATVWLRFEGSAQEHPARITRFTRRISTATRTMITEVELPNADLSLIPGGYATVSMRLNPRPHAVAVPIEAVDLGTAATVEVVGADHRVETRPIQLGIQTPRYYEVLAGLQPGEQVVMAGRATLQSGEIVNPRLEPAGDSP